MSVVMSMHWPEVTLEQYDTVRHDVKWETNVPKGAQFHVAWLAPDGFRVIDLWASSDEFQRFMETRLAPAIMRAGLQGQPVVTFTEAHAVFAPNVPGAPAARRPAARPAKKAVKKAAKTAARKARRAPARKVRRKR